MTDNVNTDVTVIGGGLGGYVAAIRASQLEAKVALVEKSELGGTCVNRGCIPTKALLEISKAISESKALKSYNIDVNLSGLDFTKIFKDANSILKKVRGHVETLINRNEITVFKGFGRLINHNTIGVVGINGDKTTINSPAIIIATGSSPVIPPIFGIDDKKVLTSDNIFNHHDKPEKLVIIGAGAAGLEFGTIYNNLGTEVTIIEMMPQILPRENEEITGYLKDILNEQGIRILTDSKVTKISSSGDELILNLENTEEKIKCNKMLLTAGRIPNTHGIGLERLVELDKGKIVVDSQMRTKTKNIYAIGDVVGRWMLAHVAIHEGLTAGENAAGGNVLIDYRAVPRCIYTNPEVAFVGLSEKEASEQLGSSHIKTAYYPLRANSRAMTMGSDKGLIKLVYKDDYNEILGAQIVSPEASELVGLFSLAITLETSLENLASTIFAHPSLSEIIWEASLRGLGRKLHIY